MIAALVLLLAGLNGVLAWSADTCTQNSPDAPYAGIFTVVLNMIGIAMLAWKGRPVGTLVAASLAAPFALFYSGKWLQLIDGATACNILTGAGSWEPSGDEPRLVLLWTAAVLSFWLGLAFALWRGYRERAHKMKQENNV